MADFSSQHEPGQAGAADAAPAGAPAVDPLATDQAAERPGFLEPDEEAVEVEADPERAPAVDPEPPAEPSGPAVGEPEPATGPEQGAGGEEAAKYLALAQRTQADFDNYRKRMGREVSAAEDRGVRKLAKELLPALDNLGLALAAAQAEGATGQLLDGLRLVHAELQAALARAGIEAFSPEGERFDPNEHEAMAQHPAEGVESGTVTQVYQAGYRAAGAVLRPARVVVAA